MTAVAEMLRTHPQSESSESLKEAIQACMECAAACVACADACLAEENVADLKRCITLNLDCADMCEAMTKMMIRRVRFDLQIVRPVIEGCIELCRACAEECDKHADMHEHCRICAEECRACEAALRAYLNN